MDTSIEAYKVIRPLISETHERIITALRAGPATHSELRTKDPVLATYVNLHTRLSELKREGTVVYTEEKRKNDRGRNERVMALA